MKISKININKLFSKYSVYFSFVIFALLLFSSSCKKQLDVKDPNDPTFATNVTDEAGLTPLLKAVYTGMGLTMVMDG